MKKTLAILLAVVMAITLFTACGDKPHPPPTPRPVLFIISTSSPRLTRLGRIGEAVHREDRCSRNRSDCGFRYL